MKNQCKTTGLKVRFLTCLFALYILTGCGERQSNTSISPLANLEHQYTNHLNQCILSLDTLLMQKDKESLIEGYKQARKYFKQSETIMAFVDRENYKALNQPNILKVHEEDLTDIKVHQPFGFQVAEEQIFADSLDLIALHKNIKLTKNRLNLILHNTHLKLKDYHLLWLIRDEIVRIATLGITGFDSPVLEASLSESIIAYREIEVILNFYEDNFENKDLLKSWKDEIALTIQTLDTTFHSFDRYHFIQSHTHKQLVLLVETQKDWKASFPFELALKNEATSLFSTETFNIGYFSGNISEKSLNNDMVALGKMLFNDKRLSKDNDMSCATCHQEQLAFTDGLATFPKQRRNTPTLLYASLQKAFFYDNRTGNLEGQIVDVVNNKAEFHSDLKKLTEFVSNDSIYTIQFKQIFKGKISDNNIRKSIAHYIRSLNTFDSKFDRNMNQKENTLTQSEIAGFNLFMGKGKCATCHFPPVFNGTVPPNFSESEMESIGVPSDTTLSAKVDDDLGRHNLFQTPERMHFFKTPSIRNINRTAPYMHNGVYQNLEQVLNFYNNGGGNGLGFELEHQTLPTDSLHLNKKEIESIIHFMKSLSDSKYETPYL